MKVCCAGTTNILRKLCDVRFGFHVSIAGGVGKAAERAAERRYDTLQLFVTNPRGWRKTPWPEESVTHFKEVVKREDIHPVVVHVSYLPNLASPEKELFEKSIDAFTTEIRRADDIGADYFVTHVGSHKGTGSEKGIKRVGRALDRIVKAAAPKALILLENTAGAGNVLGGRLEDLRDMIEATKFPDQIGICFDTCHAYAAGYNIASPEGIDDTIRQLDTLIGIDKLRCIHANDSMNGLSSRRDRHQHIGKGEIGRKGFKSILSHPALQDLPMIMETPINDDGNDATNLRTIRRIHKEVAKAGEMQRG